MTLPIADRYSLKLLFASFILFTFFGCNRMQMFYSFADSMLISRIDDFFDLTESQEEFLEKEIESLIVWHRREELPKVKFFLSKLKQRLEDGLSQEDIGWITEKYKILWASLMKTLLPPFAKFLTTVTKSQIEYLKVQLLKRNQFLVDQLNMSNEDLLKNHQNFLINQMEVWFGVLSESQTDQIKSQVQLDRSWVESRIRERTRFHELLTGWLESNKKAPDYQNLLFAWVVDPKQVWTGNFRDKVNQRKAHWIGVIRFIDGLITIRQRQFALDKIQSYIDEIVRIQN